MADIQVIRRQDDQGQGVIPMQPLKPDSVNNSSNHTTHIKNRPQRAQHAHVAVLVALVCLLISRSSPEELDTEETVLDGGQVGVRLHNHDVLDVEAVLGLGPKAEDDGAVDDGGDGEGEVVVLEVFGAKGEEEGAGDGGDEDAEGDGRVVEQTYVRNGQFLIGQWVDCVTGYVPQR